MRFTGRGLIALVCLGIASVSWGDEASDDDFFESKVRPVLHARCLECHNSEKLKAGLSLESRDGILNGGESGPAAISGKPEESLLVEVIGYRNVVQMPPKSKLPDAEIAVLTDWIRRGLPWPNSKPANPTTTASTTMEFTDEQKGFWAFQPVQHIHPPHVQTDEWVRSPIDRFVLAELESRELATAPEASARTLIRRITLDLTGLPPTPEEVSDFVTDPTPDALERLVDRLLASPRYGERWGRHWLDVARYADSNGLDENLAYANAYRYRDYVVKSMKEDKPYNRFLMEQIAGDLLEPTSDSSSSGAGQDDPDPFDRLIATGFLCLGAKMLAEDDPVKMQMDIIDEQVDTIARAVMGLTMGCARCHDHKFDPLSTEDYYGLAGVFKSTQTMDTFTVVARWHERPLATPNQLKVRDELQSLAAAQKTAIDKTRADAVDEVIQPARRRVADYMLAATMELQLAAKIKSAAPRGNLSNLSQVPGVILLEAEDYLRGNVLKDRDHYGQGIGVLVNRGESPNFTEYEVQVERAGVYQFELRYAAAEARPVKVFINQKLIKPDAAAKITGSWTPETQTWFVECFVNLTAGKNLIRLEQPIFFPHIDKLLLSPIDAMNDGGGPDSPDLNYHDATLAAQLIPSITLQWSKVLEAAKTDPKSILTAWNQFTAAGQLTIDAEMPENGVARILGDQQPQSSRELAQRYAQLFAAAQSTFDNLPAEEQSKGDAALTDPVLRAAKHLLSDPNGPYAIPEDIETHFSIEIQNQLKSDRELLARREAAIPKFPETMAVAEATPEDLKIHLRGSHLTLGRMVPRKLPRILSERQSDSRLSPPELNEGSGRLQLASWLASPHHPLTARVMVNRLWQWHFGQGLVRSPDNFGRLGERPSHPALLDWLASEFSGGYSPDEASPRDWSLKAFHRRVVATATYRQSTTYNDAAALTDPENRLLWRFHRQRMDAEVLRDSLLAIGGQLDETPGGTMLTIPNRNYVTSTANVNPAIYSSHRRSIYLPVIRSALYEVFTAFDFADPSTLAGQRDQTTVAPQALFMMNSGLVLEQVRSLVKQLIDQAQLDQRSKTKALYLLAYSREPTAVETERALRYLDQVRAQLSGTGISDPEIEERAWISLCRAVLSANEFVYVE